MGISGDDELKRHKTHLCRRNSTPELKGVIAQTVAFVTHFGSWIIPCGKVNKARQNGERIHSRPVVSEKHTDNGSYLLIGTGDGHRSEGAGFDHS